MAYTKAHRLRTPRKPKGILGLLGLGDGAITSPPQVDPDLFDDSGSTTVGEVQGNRVECSQLAPDSPWRQPGQVCAPVPGFFDSMVDYLTGLKNKVTGDPGIVPPSATAADTGPNLLVLAGLGGLAYWYFTKKKKV